MSSDQRERDAADDAQAAARNDEDPALAALVGTLLSNPEIAEAAARPDFEEIVGEAVGRALSESGTSLAEELVRRAPAMLAEHRELRLGFESRLEAIWGDALDLCETFHVICLEAGEAFVKRYRDQAAQENDPSFDALFRLHARACLVGSEVLTLLRSGYASGAHTRWRTMHELAVVAFFIREQGDDTARQYLRHDVIQAYKASLAYQRHHEALGYERLTDAEMSGLKRRRDELVAEFGTEFKYAYGWAAEALGKRARTFEAIEEAVDLGHLRPHYTMASHAVHPNARGSFFDLGANDEHASLLAGASHFGLADPGHSASISLMQVTICLLNQKIDIDGVLALLALQELLPKVGDAFLSAHKTTAEPRQ